MATLNEFMAETKMVDRWFVAKVFTAGAFAGVCLATVWSWIAAVV